MILLFSTETRVHVFVRARPNDDQISYDSCDLPTSLEFPSDKEVCIHFINFDMFVLPAASARACNAGSAAFCSVRLILNFIINSKHVHSGLNILSHLKQLWICAVQRK